MSSGPSAVTPNLGRLFVGIAVGGCALLFVVPLALRSLTMADEGYLLTQALDMANGKILYRDMDAFVTPGMWFVLAGMFKLFEPSVFTSRMPVIVGYLGLIALAYRIPSQVSGAVAGFSSVALMMVATVWAFPAWTFAFYSPFSVLFALAGLERLLAYRASTLRKDLILAGLLFGLSVWFKQNYGAFALIGAGLSLFAMRAEIGGRAGEVFRAAIVDVLWLSLGVAAVVISTVAYFGFHGALPQVFQSLVVHPFEFSGKHGIAYLGLGKLFATDFMRESVEIMTYGAQPMYRAPLPAGNIEAWGIVERLHVLLYWFPPLIFIMGATLALTGDDEARNAERGEEENSAGIHAGLLTVLLVSFFVFLGTFPRADFNHLINVYQPVVIAGVCAFAVLFKTRSFGHRLVRIASGVGVAAVLSCYLAASVYWYYTLLNSMQAEVEGSRGGVKVSYPDIASLNQVLRNLDSLSEPGDALLTVPDIAMLNFLSKHPMPSPYYNLYEHHIAHDGGAAVAEGAEKNYATIAITRQNNFFSDRVGLRDYAPVLTDYLDRYFEQKYTIGRAEYIVYTRRPTPERPVEFKSALDDCRYQAVNSEIVNHLMFRSLYQTLGPGQVTGEDSIAARCKIEVPPSGGEFVWQLDYFRPAKLRGPTTLTVEVLVGARPQPRRLFKETIDVKPHRERRNRFDAPLEYRVDLSDYAGQTINLLLKSTRRGHVVMSRNSLRGFGVTWQHPRIVAGE